MGSVGRELRRVLPAAVLLYAIFVCAIPALLLWAFASLAVPPFSAALCVGLGLALGGLLLYVRVVWELVVLAGTSAAPLGMPTQLRTDGSYAWSRNPLLLGVVAILFGEAIAFRSRALAVYALAYWTLLHASTAKTYGQLNRATSSCGWRKMPCPGCSRGCAPTIGSHFSLTVATPRPRSHARPECGWPIELS